MIAGEWSFIIYRQVGFSFPRRSVFQDAVTLGVLVKRQKSFQNEKKKENGRHLVLRSFTWLL